MSVRSRTTWTVWWHRSRAIAWVLVGIASFRFGWSNSVVLVWVASVYANCLTDWGAAEAADDRQVLDQLKRIEEMINSASGKD